MVDTALDLQKELHPDQSTSKLSDLKSEVTSEYERLSSSPSLAYLTSSPPSQSPTSQDLSTIHTYAKFMFEAGQYVVFSFFPRLTRHTQTHTQIRSGLYLTIVLRVSTF